MVMHWIFLSLLLPIFFEWTDFKKGKNGEAILDDEFQGFLHFHLFFYCAAGLLLSYRFKAHLEFFGTNSC